MNIDNLKIIETDKKPEGLVDGGIYRLEATSWMYDRQKHQLVFRKIGEPVDDRSDFVNIQFG